MRQDDTSGLLTDIRDELGHDVYYFYPDSKHHIPDTVIWGFVSACILEFLKGSVDLNSLGKTTRESIKEILERWRSRQAFEPYIQTLNLNHVLTETLEMTATLPSGVDITTGEAKLREALSDFGMEPEVALEHAKAISKLIEQVLCPSK